MQEGQLSAITRALLSAGALLFGTFRLASGAESHVYVDMRRVLGSPREFRLLLSMLSSKAVELGCPGDDCVVAGVATGGIPWATGLSILLGTPMAYVRQPKEHGTGRAVEGGDVAGRRVLLVDDVATTGGSLVSSARALRDSGAASVEALVIVDREQGASEALKGVRVSLHRLVSLKDVLREAVSMGAVDRGLADSAFRELWGTPYS